MKKFIFKLFRPYIKRKVMEAIENESYRDAIVTGIGEKLPNAPGISDKQERLYLLAVYDIVQEYSKEVVNEVLSGKK